MKYTNAYFFINGQFTYGTLEVGNDKVIKGWEEGVKAAPSIGDFCAGCGQIIRDLDGAYVIPGCIDIHNHGNSGADFSDGDYNGLIIMARYLRSHGITSFAPASMTLPYDVLSKAFSTAKRLHDEMPEGCARLMGIQMEGPFFSEKKKGAQNADYLRTPDFDAFKKLNDDCAHLVKVVDVAPELEGSCEFIKKASEIATVSIAHTDATYEEAKAAFESGATHLTHLYNAMPPIHHRKPGVIGAASERNDVTAELICDGQHVHESSVRMAFKLFPGRICLVSDSLRCCGMPDGKYELGGQDVFLKDGIAKLADGTIAGSATNLFDCLKNAIRFGIKKETAITAATLTPAKVLGVSDKIGQLAPGCFADMIICDEDLNIKEII